MISCRRLRYTYGGMYDEPFFDASSSMWQRMAFVITEQLSDISSCFPRWTLCNLEGSSPGTDWGKFGSTRSIRHSHVRGVVFSTIAALTVLPVFIARIAESDRYVAPGGVSWRCS
jgi:hypothetical protein